jgi:nitrogen fixation NifU-like protein
MDHFMNPRNIGIIEDANAIIQVGDPTCGDSLLLFLTIENDSVLDVKFRIKGCAAAIATSSMTTEMVKGLTVEEALALTDEQVADALGGLPTLSMRERGRDEEEKAVIISRSRRTDFRSDRLAVSDK